MVIVRYWAAARAAAGVAEERFAVTSLAGLEQAAIARHGEPLRAVLAVASLLTQDGVRLAPDALLADGTVVEVLPPFAGG